MNIYDTANQLAQEIKKSEEYVNYKMAKQVLDLNTTLKEKMTQFEQKRYEVQIQAMQTGKQDEAKYKEVQDLYGGGSLMSKKDFLVLILLVIIILLIISK